jgi:hypothetical protein
MSDRQLPVRPDLEQLKHQAKDLLRAIKRREAQALEELRRNHPRPLKPAETKLADAQLTLARSYGVQSWPRLVQACKVVDAIWRDEPEELRTLIGKHPDLLNQMARGTESCNWGPPLSYAANLGMDRIIEMLRGMGSQDIMHAMDRAVLQGRIDTARLLYKMGARPARGAVMGPAETHNFEGMAYLVELGAEICDQKADRLAPVAMVLATYCRDPIGKHRCLELFAEHGIELPDTPVMALHRGRIDLLEEHLRRDSKLLMRTFSHNEIYAPELIWNGEPYAANGTPLDGTTLLHMSIDFFELPIARWLIDAGMDVNVKAAVDNEGFGGHTPLFNCVVRQLGSDGTADFARLLLDHGADPKVRASLRKRLNGADDETMHEYRDVTPLEWGRQFHDKEFVDEEAMKCIEAISR